MAQKARRLIILENKRRTELDKEKANYAAKLWKKTKTIELNHSTDTMDNSASGKEAVNSEKQTLESVSQKFVNTTEDSSLSTWILKMLMLTFVTQIKIPHEVWLQQISRAKGGSSDNQFCVYCHIWE